MKIGLKAGKLRLLIFTAPFKFYRIKLKKEKSIDRRKRDSLSLKNCQVKGLKKFIFRKFRPTISFYCHFFHLHYAVYSIYVWKINHIAVLWKLEKTNPSRDIMRDYCFTLYRIQWVLVHLKTYHLKIFSTVWIKWWKNINTCASMQKQEKE